VNELSASLPRGKRLLVRAQNDAAGIALFRKLLTEDAITYVVFEGEGEETRYYDAILDIAGDGTWQWTSLRELHA
jgi:hypothetical protein